MMYRNDMQRATLRATRKSPNGTPQRKVLTISDSEEVNATIATGIAKEASGSELLSCVLPVEQQNDRNGVPVVQEVFFDKFIFPQVEQQQDYFRDAHNEPYRLATFSLLMGVLPRKDHYWGQIGDRDGATASDNAEVIADHFILNELQRGKSLEHTMDSRFLQRIDQPGCEALKASLVKVSEVDAVVIFVRGRGDEDVKRTHITAAFEAACPENVPVFAVKVDDDDIDGHVSAEDIRNVMNMLTAHETGCGMTTAGLYSAKAGKETAHQLHTAFTVSGLLDADASALTGAGVREAFEVFEAHRITSRMLIDKRDEATLKTFLEKYLKVGHVGVVEAIVDMVRPHWIAFP